MNKLLALTTVAAIAVSSSAFALSDKELLGKATVSLSDAVTTAEKQGGKAVNADLAEEKNTPVWEIKLLSGDKEHKVKVNGTNGTIIEAKKD
jgi:uncharacterized membrane protein YkoI